MTTLVLTEFPHVCIKNLWKHPDVLPADRCKLKKYGDSVIDGKIEVNYGMKHQYGRLYSNNFSCINMTKSVRSTLFSDTEYDLDIINCHACILLGLVEGSGLPDECLRYYVNNRQKVFDEIKINEKAIKTSNELNGDTKTHEDVIKLLFTILLYGGTINTWATKLGFNEIDYKLSSFVSEYVEELKLIAEVMVKRYPEIQHEVYIKECAKERNAVKYRNETKKDKRRKDEIFDEAKFKVSTFKTLSVILQDYERQIVIAVFEIIKPLGVVITSYNYDGFQVLKTSFNLQLIEKINEIIQIKYPHVAFVVKPFHESLDVSCIPEPKPYINYTDYSFYESTENGKCEYFNKFIVMTKKPCVYNILDERGNIINQFTANKLCDAYAEYNLLDGYIGSSNKIVKEKLVYLPPPLICRACDYNSWRGFEIENTVAIPGVSCERVYEHILEMSGLNNTTAVYNYLLNWIAWVLQFPAKKTGVCIILYSKEQGTGKSCLAENLFKMLLGKGKIVITGNIDKLFGRFSNTAEAHVVVLNEASGKDTKNIHEIIKDCITREVQVLERKGIDAYEVDDFSNYILTTNNISCVDIKGEDRRFVPIKVGITKRKNVEYFRALRADLECPNVMRKFYDEMMQRDLTNWNAERDIPTTELKADIISTCVSPYDEFYNYLIEDEIYKKEPFVKDTQDYKIKPIDFYQMFRLFWLQVGRHGLCPDNKKFGVEIKHLKNIVFKHHTKFNMYYIRVSE